MFAVKYKIEYLYHDNPCTFFIWKCQKLMMNEFEKLATFCVFFRPIYHFLIYSNLQRNHILGINSQSSLSYYIIEWKGGGRLNLYKNFMYRWEWVLQKYMLCTNMLRSRPMIWRNKKNIRMNDIYCHLLLSSLLLSLLSLLLDFSIVNWVTSLCFEQIETIHILWIHK